MVRIELPRETAGASTIFSDNRRSATSSTVRTLISAIMLSTPVILLAVLGYRHRWVSEDAFISLRVVDQILAGNGPVFNAGERVEAHTNPLWVAILTLFGLLGGDLARSAVFLGIAFASIGLLAGLAGAFRLDQRLSRMDVDHRPYFVLPVGASVFVAVPVSWDFVTSGLETGLGFGWLGISFWLLVRCLDSAPEIFSWQWYKSAMVLSLGPLVRPDFAIFSAGFLLALFYLRIYSRHHRVRFRDLGPLVLAAAILPVGYQIFRMGYYAALVPNTALAKEAGESNWEQGWIYFNDFVDPYRLWIPLALLLGLLAVKSFTAISRRDWPTLVLLTIPLFTAGLHATYVVRVGGDFMHGRLLLPALFVLALPLAAVRMPLMIRPRDIVVATMITVLLAWSFVAATTLRWPHGPDVDEDTGIVDERAFYIEETEHPNPVTLEDYAENDFHWLRLGRNARERAEDGPRAVVIQNSNYRVADHVPDDVDLVVPAGNIGIFGYSAGTRVLIVDRLGLADPFGGRLLLEERGRPGHEKALPMIWVTARYTGFETEDVDDESFVSVRRVIECGQVAELIEATTAPLTVSRFVENIRLSWSFHTMRIPPDPPEAEELFCSGVVSAR